MNYFQAHRIIVRDLPAILPNGGTAKELAHLLFDSPSTSFDARHRVCDAVKALVHGPRSACHPRTTPTASQIDDAFQCYSRIEWNGFRIHKLGKVWDIAAASGAWRSREIDGMSLTELRVALIAAERQVENLTGELNGIGECPGCAMYREGRATKRDGVPF